MINALDKGKWEEEIAKVQEPVQYLLMALFTIFKNQRKDFKEKELWLIYLQCIKQQIDKDFQKLYEEMKDV